MSFKGEIIFLDATNNHNNDIIKLRCGGWVVIHCRSVTDALPHLKSSVSGIVAKLGHAMDGSDSGLDLIERAKSMFATETPMTSSGTNSENAIQQQQIGTARNRPPCCIIFSSSASTNEQKRNRCFLRGVDAVTNSIDDVLTLLQFHESQKRQAKGEFQPGKDYEQFVLSLGAVPSILPSRGRIVFMNSTDSSIAEIRQLRQWGFEVVQCRNIEDTCKALTSYGEGKKQVLVTKLGVEGKGGNDSGVKLLRRLKLSASQGANPTQDSSMVEDGPQPATADRYNGVQCIVFSGTAMTDQHIKNICFQAGAEQVSDNIVDVANIAATLMSRLKISSSSSSSSSTSSTTSSSNNNSPSLQASQATPQNATPRALGLATAAVYPTETSPSQQRRENGSSQDAAQTEAMDESYLGDPEGQLSGGGATSSMETPAAKAMCATTDFHSQPRQPQRLAAPSAWEDTVANCNLLSQQQLQQLGLTRDHVERALCSSAHAPHRRHRHRRKPSSSPSSSSFSSRSSSSSSSSPPPNPTFRRRASQNLPTVWNFSCGNIEDQLVPIYTPQELLYIQQNKESFQRVRIVCISDTHCLHRNFAFDDVCMPKTADILISCGDFCYRPKNKDQIREFNAWLGLVPYATKIVISGNHDFACDKAHCSGKSPEAARKELLSNATHYLADSSCVVHGIRFYGTPWNHSVNMAFGMERSKRGEYFRKIPECDILLTHMPPRGILDLGKNDRLWGDATLRSQVLHALQPRPPRVHVFGHVHEMYGFEYHAPPMSGGSSSIPVAAASSPATSRGTTFINCALKWDPVTVRRPVVFDCYVSK